MQRVGGMQQVFCGFLVVSAIRSMRSGRARHPEGAKGPGVSTACRASRSRHSASIRVASRAAWLTTSEGPCVGFVLRLAVRNRAEGSGSDGVPWDVWRDARHCAAGMPLRPSEAIPGLVTASGNRDRCKFRQLLDQPVSDGVVGTVDGGTDLLRDSFISQAPAFDGRANAVQPGCDGLRG